MSNRIQAQIIRTPGREDYLAECLDSLKGEPLDIVLDDFGPHLETRCRFIESATTEFVTFIDDDDAVKKGTCDKLLSAYDAGDVEYQVGVHGYEKHFGEHITSPTELVFNHPFDFDRSIKEFHFPRVALLRTDVAKEIVKFIRTLPPISEVYPEFLINTSAGLLGKWVCVPEVGYGYRQHKSNWVATAPHDTYRSTTKKLLLSIKEGLGEQARQQSEAEPN